MIVNFYTEKREARIILSVYNVYYGKAPMNFQVLFITSDANQIRTLNNMDIYIYICMFIYKNMCVCMYIREYMCIIIISCKHH